MSRRTWKYLLSAIWVVVLIHFLKDVTQDILQIPTVLDVFGNIQEDVSWLPLWLQWLVYGAGVGSVLAEVFLLFAIPRILRVSDLARLEWWVKIVLIFMLIYFSTVVLLDPTINGGRS